MAGTRAKFKVDSIERSIGSMPVLNDDGTQKKGESGYILYGPVEMRTIKMSPVFGNGDSNHENTKFWQASPSGSLNLSCVNLAAAEVFGLGEEFYVDFTRAPK